MKFEYIELNIVDGKFIIDYSVKKIRCLLVRKIFF